MASPTSTLLPSQQKAWWKEAIVYQVYPQSFCDSNGDGIGDLQGIISKLDYVKSLGATVLWLCPHLASPFVDNGYDCSDYEKVRPEFGTMEDNQELIDAAHKRGIKIMMDLVVNHTSDQHAWFQESRQNRDNEKADWYIWRDAKTLSDGSRVPPNNWASIWGGSAWHWDDKRGQYFLHLFSDKQPDLNWDCRAMREAVYAMVNRWRAKGVDGWRLDAINFISKPTALPEDRDTVDIPDAPVMQPAEPFQPAFSMFSSGPRVHKYLAELYQRCLKPDVMTVGEAAGATPEQSVQYTRWEGRKEKELQLVFSTDHVDLYGGFQLGPAPPLRQGDMRNTIARWQSSLPREGSWLSSFMSNHDLPRPLSNFLRAESPSQRHAAAKLLALFQACQTGTLFVYQGEELGMINVPEDWPIENYPDLVSQKFYDEQLEKRRKETGQERPDMKDVMAAIRRKARDNSRTPMPWDGSPLAGFTTSDKGPWMPVNPDNVTCNVADQERDPDSVLNYWRRALQLRKANPVLTYGLFDLVDLRPTDVKGGDENEHGVFTFTRTYGEQRALFVGNFDPVAHEVDLPSLGLLGDEAEPLMCAGPGGDLKKLEPFEARVYLL